MRLWPDTAEVSQAGRLSIGGCDVEALCDAWATPLYILDEETFRASCRTYVSSLAARYPGPGGVYYSGKSLLNTTVARWAHEAGLGIDAASAGEVHVALKAGVPGRRLHLHGNAKPREELEFAARNEIGAIVVDNLDELRLVGEVGRTLERDMPVLLRIAPGVGAATHPHIQTGLDTAKFGLIVNHLPRAARVLRSDARLRLVGLHFHIGSQIFDLAAYAEAVDVLLDARAMLADALGQMPEQLSPGGGLAIPYTSDDPDTDIDSFVRVVSEATLAGCARRSMPLPRLVLEPGRSISGRAAVAAYTVISRKDTGEAAALEGGPAGYVHLDGGMADNLRPALYGARYEAAVATRMNAELTRRVRIAGRYCESSDVMIGDILMPQIEPGDIVVMPNCGAYTISMASNYNLTRRPAVISVRDGRASLVQRRETYEDLLARDVGMLAD
jgi:diaminopimelate decarboxylase